MYRLYSNGVLTPDYFCNATLPILPSISQEWIAESGVTNVSGIVEVTTSKVLETYVHTIVLKKVTFTKGNSDFTLGDSYTYGELITTN